MPNMGGWPSNQSLYQQPPLQQRAMQSRQSLQQFMNQHQQAADNQQLASRPQPQLPPSPLVNPLLPSLQAAPQMMQQQGNFQAGSFTPANRSYDGSFSSAGLIPGPGFTPAPQFVPGQSATPGRTGGVAAPMEPLTAGSVEVSTPAILAPSNGGQSWMDQYNSQHNLTPQAGDSSGWIYPQTNSTPGTSSTPWLDAYNASLGGGSQLSNNALQSGGLYSSNTSSGSIGNFGVLVSDERQKEDISPANKDIHDFMSKIGAHNYTYKDPQFNSASHPEGQVYTSLMAQELQRTKLGQQAVIETDKGLMVDYARLGAVNLAAATVMYQEQQKLQAQIRALQAKFHERFSEKDEES